MRQPTPAGDDLSDRALAAYLEVASRIAARCSDEQLGITPRDYLTADPLGSDAATAPADANE